MTPYLSHYQYLATNADDPAVQTLARKILAFQAIQARRKRFFDHEDAQGGWRGKEFTPVFKSEEIGKKKVEVGKVIKSLVRALMI